MIVGMFLPGCRAWLLDAVWTWAATRIRVRLPAAVPSLAEQENDWVGMRRMRLLVRLFTTYLALCHFPEEMSATREPDPGLVQARMSAPRRKPSAGARRSITICYI
jgi:hypothetical protein